MKRSFLQVYWQVRQWKRKRKKVEDRPIEILQTEKHKEERLKNNLNKQNLSALREHNNQQNKYTTEFSGAERQTRSVGGGTLEK